MAEEAEEGKDNPVLGTAYEKQGSTILAFPWKVPIKYWKNTEGFFLLFFFFWSMVWANLKPLAP